MEHRSAIGLFLSLAVHLNRPAAALNARLPIGRGARALHTTTAAAYAGDTSSYIVDVDANLLHADLSDDIDHHIQVSSTLVGMQRGHMRQVRVLHGMRYATAVDPRPHTPHDHDVLLVILLCDPGSLFGWGEAIRGTWKHSGRQSGLFGTGATKAQCEQLIPLIGCD